VPTYTSHTVFEVVRNIKAFLKLDVGLVRGEVPHLEQQIKARERKLHQAHNRIRKLSQKLEQAGELPLKKDRQLERSSKRSSRAHEKRHPPETDEKSVGQGHELSYEALYETRIQAKGPDAAIGAGELSFETIGRLLLAILTREGLEPTDTLVDLGCGTGRLAVHAIPFLSDGRYVGIDIAQAMLSEAQKRVETTIPDPPCQVSWIHQTTPIFELETDSVDMICAFSVINHMEHEDAYSYLKGALRVVRPGGRFVFTCLPINTERGRE
jgi:2-polyprenyl-3-methyl-5-hydroxy-6-metoxy-1,4-benzoquinol methylase